MGRRLTYLLRPNVSRPSHSVTNLDTPPATDVGYCSQGDLEGDSDVMLFDSELSGSIGLLPPLAFHLYQKPRQRLRFAHMESIQTTVGPLVGMTWKRMQKFGGMRPTGKREDRLWTQFQKSPDRTARARKTGLMALRGRTECSTRALGLSDKCGCQEFGIGGEGIVCCHRGH